jgi:hypothetical protein
MKQALIIESVLAQYQDDTYTISDLKELENGSYLPSWWNNMGKVSCYSYAEPSLSFGKGMTEIYAPNGLVAFALLLITQKEFMDSDEFCPATETAESLSDKLRSCWRFQDILSWGSQEQQLSIWAAYCLLFRKSRVETDIDKFHLHCIESRGFVFSASNNPPYGRSFPKAGEMVSLVRFETGNGSGHGWMHDLMRSMPATGQICKDWMSCGDDARHWYLESWVQAHQINVEGIARAHNLKLLRKRVQVSDWEQHFCDGEQYVERVSK